MKFMSPLDTANPDDPNEISFAKGEILDIVDKQGKWWQAKKADGTSGSMWLFTVWSTTPANSFPQLHHPIIFTSSKKISYVAEHSLQVCADIAILNKPISRQLHYCSRPSAMPSFRLALIMWTQPIQSHIYRPCI